MELRPPSYLPYAEPFCLKSGPIAFLLLHGFTGTPYEMRELGQRLAEAGYTSLGVCLAGHATRWQDLVNTTWRDWFNSALAGYEQLVGQSEAVFVAGLSMGAALALHLAAHRPVSGVVGMSTPLQASLRQRLMIPFARIRPYVMKRNGSSILDPTAKALHPTYDRIPLRPAASLADLLDHLWDDLPEVRTPVLLIHSRQDPVADPANVPLILDRLGSTDKALHWVEHSAHIITEDYDKEEVFIQTLCFAKRLSDL